MEVACLETTGMIFVMLEGNHIDIIWKVVTEEDFPQSLAIHKNLASGAVPELVFGRNEPALIHYHKQIAAAVGSNRLRDMQD